MDLKKLKKFIIVAVILVIVLVIGLNCCSSVGPTERGVMLTFGKPSTESLEPGLHFKSPIGQEVRTWDLSLNEYSKEFTTGQDGAISKDMQTIGVKFTLYWKYDADRIPEIARNFSSEEKIKQPISTAVKAALKAEIGKYSVEELIQTQAKITEDVRAAFENDKDVSSLPIIISSFKIDNWDWSDDYDAMIKKTMVRRQEVEQMKQEVALSEQAAQKQVKEAEAEKQRIELESQAALIKAQKEAEATLARAEGDAEARKVKAEAEKYEAQQIAQAAQMKREQWAHEEKMEQMAVEKVKWQHWDGDLNPKYVPITAAGTIVDLQSSK